ncbi:MAG: hypothetical protein LBT76_06070 [Tannerella sp.]|jgi:hypothetical protein|nr:hypothetical protein [Tannerella sp.]
MLTSFIISLVGSVACNPADSEILFDGTNADRWTATGNVSLKNGVFLLKGVHAQAAVKNGNCTGILKAKAAGLRFTFGANSREREFGKPEHCIEMKKVCGLTAKDLFKSHIHI